MWYYGTMSRVSLEARFWTKVDTSDSCWVWTAAKAKGGYGMFWVAPKMRMAHRVAYELSVGPIPKGLDLDHLCRNRACVNPSHLEPVTHLENVRRAPTHYGSRTACKNGHEFDPENTFIRQGGARGCRKCQAAYNREYRRRKRSA